MLVPGAPQTEDADEVCEQSHDIGSLKVLLLQPSAAELPSASTSDLTLACVCHSHPPFRMPADHVQPNNCAGGSATRPDTTHSHRSSAISASTAPCSTSMTSSKCRFSYVTCTLDNSCHATWQGPFDGVLGFSQGGCVASVLCGMHAKGVRSFPFRFAIIISGTRVW